MCIVGSRFRKRRQVAGRRRAVIRKHELLQCAELLCQCRGNLLRQAPGGSCEHTRIVFIRPVPAHQKQMAGYKELSHQGKG